MWLFLGAISRQYGFQLFDGHLTVPNFTRAYHALIGFLSSLVDWTGFFGWRTGAHSCALVRSRGRVRVGRRRRRDHVSGTCRRCKEQQKHSRQKISQNLLLFAISTHFSKTDSHIQDIGSGRSCCRPTSNPSDFFDAWPFSHSDISLIVSTPCFFLSLLSSAPSDPSDPIDPCFSLPVRASRRAL